MIKLQCRKAGSLVCLLLIFTSGFMASWFLPRAKAATTIISMTPAGGSVGTTVQLTANITSANGTYQILWDGGVIVPNATAVGNNVNASFIVPPTTSGDHVVMVVDVAKGENATNTFPVSTAYSLNVLPQLVLPAQMQEGDAFQVSLNMTGGEQGKTNVANITVTAPNSASYTSLGNITTENDGNGTLIVNYPGDFSVGANTNFTGQYGILFNGTFASAAFFVGLTNSSEYHRNQALDVKAIYEPGENVTLAITGMDMNYSTSVTADTTGTVRYVNFTILSKASIGTYVVNVTSLSGPTSKTPPDVQSFTIPGFPVNITTRNLAGEPVQNVNVGIFENLQSVSNLTSDVNGALSGLALEVGSYTCNASFQGQDVGNLAMGVNETSTAFDLYCNLTNLRVTVVDEDGILIPYVDLNLTTTNPNSTISVEPTGINGTSNIHSLLSLFDNVPLDYTLNASRYGTQFNISYLQLPIAAWFDVRIVVPKMSLQVNVTDGNFQPIANADVNASELEGGLFYSGTTSTNGSVTLNCTLGKYLVEVYSGMIELNETTVDVNDTTVGTTIICELYGLNVTVKVADYFGQPIPNMNVTLRRSGFESSGVSGSDGLVLFRNIIGGNLSLTVRFTGQSDASAVTSASVDNSTTIEVKLDKYVMLASLLIETGQLATVAIIVLAMVLVLCWEVYRRIRAKPKENES